MPVTVEYKLLSATKSPSWSGSNVKLQPRRKKQPWSVSTDGENVVLHRKKDSREIKVPVKALSAADQQSVAEQTGGAKNPFE